MIDLHCHLLPGVDDGPVTMDESLEMARVAVAAGTTEIVATPHVDAQLRLDPASFAPAVVELSQALERAGIGLRVHAGGEVALDRYLDLSEDARAAARLGSGPYLLLEAPLAVAAGAFDRMLHALLERGVPMVIAHPERAPAFQREPAKLAALVSAGALTQITAGSLSGMFGSTVRAYAQQLVADGLAHDLSSDAHDPYRRGPGLHQGLEAMAADLPGSAALADWMTVDVPRAVLDGAPVPPRPAVTIPPARRRGRLARLLGG